MDNEDLSRDHYSYTSSDIQVLEGLEAIRKRPGMYIATTSSRGLHHLVWEIVDNSIDEALSGYATHIIVKVEKDNVVSVSDNGRGMPVGIHPKTGISTVETIFTVLHAGGKFGGGAYKVSGGLHGVGASVVNALSEWLEVFINIDSKSYYVKFANGGHIQQALTQTGTCSPHEHGTTVRFKADPTIFTETTVYDHDILRNRLRELAYLNKGLKIDFTDERLDQPHYESFCYEGGISEYVKFLNQKKGVVNPDPIDIEGDTDNIHVEVAMQYNDGYSSNIYSFCNNINTVEGGTHEEGFQLALTRTINKYAQDSNLVKNSDEPLTGDDCREGLTAIISVKHPDPQYEGQTKTKLGNSEVRKIVSNIFGDQLSRYLMENPKQAHAIIEKIISASKVRLAAKKARENARRQTGLELANMPGKLTDCSCRDPQLCEIFLVEGDSAGGSAKQGRDPKHQAVLPLRGKILNVQKASEHQIYDNDVIRSMITAFGCGIGENMDLTKLRYHKIVIMTDADVDGAHIATLLLTFLYRHFKPVIEGGYVYLAQPPLYKVTKGSVDKYAYTDEELEEIKKEVGDRFALQRYKGLGEMNPEQLWETTMDPAKRVFIQVTIDNAALADQAFELLMGEEVEPRRQYIVENAHFVKNLDTV